MAANMYGIDVAQLYKDKEAIQGARTRNKLNALQLSEAERTVAERPEKQKKEAERVNMMQGLRGKAYAGDDQAQQQLLAIDPEGGAKFIDALSKMDEKKIAAAKASVEEMGQMSAYVLQGESPEEQQRRYQVVYAGVSPEAQEKLPKTYSPEFMEMSLAKASSMDKLLENPKALRIGDSDVVYKGGRKIREAKRPVSEKSGKASGGLKSADESLMYRQAGELLGGMFDQQGNLTNLDPTTRNKVQGIASEAVKLYQKKGNISRTEAVKLAASKYGLTIPEGQGEDPLGIR